MRSYLLRCKHRFCFSQSPKTFFVEEITKVKPSLKGRYAILKIEKRALSTWELLDLLRPFACNIGYAGLKDKNATTVQYLSVDSRDLSKIQRLHHKRWRLLDYFLAKEPLKMGDLLGNRFRINLSRVEKMRALERSFYELAEVGMPNYFGYQRFGADGVRQARAYVEGDYFPKNRRLEKMLLFIYQSDLFNRWLDERIRMSGNRFRTLTGDVYRIGKRYIIADEPPKGGVVTGLLPGGRAIQAKKEARRIEERYDEPLPAKGERRDAIVYPKELRFEPQDDGIWISFVLPKGSYATILIENLLGRTIGYKGA